MNSIEKIGASERAQMLCVDPLKLFNSSHTEMHTTDAQDLANLQLEALKFRFGEQRDRIPVLHKLADKQGITELQTLDDVVPLLFEHTMYKSYPSSLLDKCRFTDLNRWLSRLTIHDLTSIDVSACKSIDEWLDAMDLESPLSIVHSSGTSGTMSFLPCGKDDRDLWYRIWQCVTLQRFGETPHPNADPEIWAIYPFFRSGASGHLRVQDGVAKYIAGSEERMLTAYRGRMSSDLLYLSGRIKAAQARGDLDRLEISPELLSRKAEFEALQADMPEHMAKFFSDVADKLKGKRVFIVATWNLLHDMAKSGLALGLEHVFSPDSTVVTGGGAKGMTPPEGWADDVKRFIGAPVDNTYGMSELHGVCMECKNGHFHFPPWIIPFLLDPDTSAALPRTGVVTGRAAFVDLTMESRWGGFISGDRITVHWDNQCGCGQTTNYITGRVERYSELQGGDDKISCAATEGAHKEAMDFLNSSVT